jgi:glycosyltransferase involved in cell wall biosynthesis
MKVAFINTPWSQPTLPLTVVDSIALWTQAIAPYLTPTCNVTIYGNREGATQSIDHYGPIQFRRVWVTPDYYTKPVLTKLLGRNAILSPYYFGLYILQIALDLRKQNYDIVHLHCFPQFVPIIRRLNPRLKIVLHAHEEWLVQFDRTKIEPMIAAADLIFGCSEYLVRRFRQAFPEYRDRFQPMFNGVDPDRFHPSTHIPHAPKQLLFVGRISPEKGVHILLEAFERVIQHYPDVELRIVGYDGPLTREFLEALSDDPAVRDLVRFCDKPYSETLRASLSKSAASKVHWVGLVEHHQVAALLQTTDILINPSFSESFGNSLVEAMTAGVPAIATRVGGIQDTVVDGETGLLISPGNVEDLTDRILMLLNDRDRAQAMGQAGRARMLNHFTWDAIAQNLYKSYQDCSSR